MLCTHEPAKRNVTKVYMCKQLLFLKPGSHRVFRQSANAPDSRRVIPNFLCEHSRRNSLGERRQSLRVGD